MPRTTSWHQEATARAVAAVVLISALFAPGARAASAAPMIVAAGDIACEDVPCPAQRATARLIRRIDPRAVLTLGDNQYDRGALSEFRASYDGNWGRLKARIYPSPGNHEYRTARAAGYFAYFGRRARPGNDGTYSFDLGEWHIVSVNSGRERIRPSQLRWILRDLRRDGHRCELAYWHHPRWSSGRGHRSDPAMAGLWRVMYRAGVDVVLNAHAHSYERFAPLGPTGRRSTFGVREFVVGTGGAPLARHGAPVRGSERRIDDRWGVLQLFLRTGGYGWQFRAVGAGTLDRGSDPCHGAPRN